MRGDVPGALVCMAAVASVMMGCSAGVGEALDEQHAYPGGTYGTAEGEVAPPALTWHGSGERGRSGTISIGDYYDRDGSKGINALLVDQSTAWCGVCQAAAGKLAENMREGWRQRGIHVITLITESADHRPATVETALAWKHRFGLDGTAVVADPARSFRETLAESEAPYPYELVIDPRTMEIVDVEVGYDGKGEFPAVVALAKRNAEKR